jgi:hypothetical protein
MGNFQRLLYGVPEITQDYIDGVSQEAFDLVQLTNGALWEHTEGVTLRDRQRLENLFVVAGNLSSIGHVPSRTVGLKRSEPYIDPLTRLQLTEISQKLT